MKISRIKPGLEELLKYVEEIEHAGFGISTEVREYRVENFPGEFDNLDINALEDILEKFDLKPKFLYFLVDDINKCLINKNIFTEVADLNIEDDIIVFEAFSSQIYYLYDGGGNFLEGPCHDLEIGHGGLIMLRYSGGDPGFLLKNIHNPSFHEIGENIPFDHFPNTRGISFMDNMEEVYFKDPRIDPGRENDRDYILMTVKKNGWSLQFASAGLKDDKELITEACLKNAGAFLFASDRLKNDTEFVADILSNTSGRIYAYLDQEMRESAEIIKSLEILEAAKQSQKEKEKEERDEEGNLPF